MAILESNLWQQGMPAPRAYDSWRGEEQCDWLIVGAGLTGLAAARHLATKRRGERIVMVDAAKIGNGSSSRSSGFIVSSGHFSNRHQQNQTLYEMGLEGISELRQLVQVNQIDCDWNDSGRLIAARGKAGIMSLRRAKRVLDQVGSRYDLLSGDEVRLRTGMQGYKQAIHQHESVQVNPAKLYLGLVNALPDEVEVYPSSRILKLTKEQGHWIASLDSGTIRARKVLVTNNACATSLGLGDNKVFPMRTYIGVYRPTSIQDLSGQLGEDPSWGLTSIERVGSSLRNVDGQVFVRNFAACGFEQDGRSDELEQAVNLQHTTIKSRFSEVEFELQGAWVGEIGVTANAAQLFGGVNENLFVSAGYNGHGMAQATVSGRLLVEAALGESSPQLEAIRRLPRPTWIPKPKVLYPCVNLYLSYLNWRFSDEI